MIRRLTWVVAAIYFGGADQRWGNAYRTVNAFVNYITRVLMGADDGQHAAMRLARAQSGPSASRK